jgi:hypothetical protein
MRFPKPFFRVSKGAWYVQLGKRQISLGRQQFPVRVAQPGKGGLAAWLFVNYARRHSCCY